MSRKRTEHYGGLGSISVVPSPISSFSPAITSKEYHMTTIDLSSLSRRSFLAISGVGLAATTFPQEIFAQSRGNILIIASGQDIPSFDPQAPSEGLCVGLL
jgi:hypothetical protein